MNKTLLLSLFLCHFIGDCYLQSESLARKKSRDLKYQLLHFVLYALSYFPLILLYGKGIIKLLLYLQLMHALIDLFFFFYKKKTNWIPSIFSPLKLYCEKERKQENNLREFNLYFADQILHIIIIIMIYALTSPRANSSPLLLTSLGLKINELFHLFGLDSLVFTKVILSVVVIHKPMNIFISLFLSGFTPNIKKEIDSSGKNAGRYIGTLERIIILLFISIEQYTAIGFILTAKSITRFDKIKKDIDFGEYYLIGTLLSFLLIMLYSTIISV